MVRPASARVRRSLEADFDEVIRTESRRGSAFSRNCSAEVASRRALKRPRSSLARRRSIARRAVESCRGQRPLPSIWLQPTSEIDVMQFLASTPGSRAIRGWPLGAGSSSRHRSRRDSSLAAACSSRATGHRRGSRAQVCLPAAPLLLPHHRCGGAATSSASDERLLRLGCLGLLERWEVRLKHLRLGFRRVLSLNTAALGVLDLVIGFFGARLSNLEGGNDRVFYSRGASDF
eukprot:scaffold43384_cov63-Phaeocystis_antarctica.AAC.3